MTLVIGLTGSIGTGKSTIAKRFRDLHIPVIDADMIAREVVEPDKPAYRHIVAAFGENILMRDKTLNRAALGDIVFNDATKREQLNALIHPEIRAEMIRQRDEWLEKQVPVIVLDIPLLFESDLTHLVDKTLVVYVDEATQLKRIITRDKSSKEAAQQRMNTQIPVSEKAKKADAIIDNNGTVKDSYRQLQEILQAWGVQ